MVKAKKGSLATMGSAGKMAPPSARSISVPNKTSVSSTPRNKGSKR